MCRGSRVPGWQARRGSFGVLRRGMLIEASTVIHGRGCGSLRMTVLLELFLQTSACMKHQSRFTLALAGFLFLTLHCGHAQVPLPAPPPAISGSSAALIARGEFIVRNAAVCGGCHSASERDPDGPLSGGREFRDGRIGVARASNLT